jgi:hypothetical protein
VVISIDDFSWFLDQALDQMVAIVRDLGDELANRAPDLPGANSPYAILSHCLGVMAWWGGDAISGREVDRDRDAEFAGSGSTEDLIERSLGVRRQLASDIAAAELEAPLRRPVDPPDDALPFGTSQGGAAFHIYEEIAQHLGQLEITRDILRSAPRAR